MLCYKFMHFIQISDLCLCDFLNLIVDYKKCNIIITFLIRISMSVFVSLCCILTLCITQVILLWLKNWLKQKSGPIHIKTVYKTVNKMCTVNCLKKKKKVNQNIHARERGKKNHFSVTVIEQGKKGKNSLLSRFNTKTTTTTLELHKIKC